VLLRKFGMSCWFCSPSCRAIHYIVVKQRARVQQLKCCTSVDNALVGDIAASANKTPRAKCRTKSLAPGKYKPTDLGKWGTKVFVNLCPTRMLEVEQCAQPYVYSRSYVRK
jgi:hypothetical protein